MKALPMFEILKKLADADKIESGGWFPVYMYGKKDQPMFRDADADTPVQAVRMKVRSMRSTAYEKCNDECQRIGLQKIKAAKSSDQDSVSAAQARITVRKRFATLLVALENASPGVDGEQPVTEEVAITMLDDPSLKWFCDQVFDVASKDENFGAATLGNVDAPISQSAPNS